MSTEPEPGPAPGRRSARGDDSVAGGDLIAIVAARNEGDRIGDALDALAEAFPGAGLIVADDASEDGTAAAAREHGARVVSGERSRGKGANVSRAAESALRELEGGADPVVLLCDADLAASASELRPLVEAVERGDCDLAVAAFARRVGGGFGLAVGFSGWAIERRSGFRPRAPISGQRAMRASVLRRLLPFAQGYGMETGMSIDAVRAGYRIEEIELDLAHRATGRTLGGFLHRGRQLLHILRAYLSRRSPS